MNYARERGKEKEPHVDIFVVIIGHGEWKRVVELRKITTALLKKTVALKRTVDFLIPSRFWFF